MSLLYNEQESDVYQKTLMKDNTMCAVQVNWEQDTPEYCLLLGSIQKNIK